MIEDYLAGTTGSFFIPAFTTAPLITVSDGDPLPSVPEHSLTLALDYRQQLASNDWAILYHLDGKYASDAQSQFNDTINFGRDFFEIDSYSVVNASVTLDAQKWSASLFVRNLTNEQNLSAGNTAAAAGGVHQYYFSLRPRTIGLSLNYVFDQN